MGRPGNPGYDLENFDRADNERRKQTLARNCRIIAGAGGPARIELVAAARRVFVEYRDPRDIGPDGECDMNEGMVRLSRALEAFDEVEV